MSEANADAGAPCEQKPLRRVLIVFGEVKTHWLQKMVNAVLGKPPIELGVRDPETLVDILKWSGDDRLICENFIFDRHAKILDKNRFPNLRMILLNRHPLDQFVADIWYQMKVAHSRKMPDPGASVDENARGLLLGKYDDVLDGPFEETFKAELRRKILEWLDSNRCLEIKYEDLVDDTEETLVRCLDHLEIRYNRADLAPIVEEHRLEKPGLDGRWRDGNGAQRDDKAYPGDWRTVFKTEDIPALKAKYAGMFNRQGYAIEQFEQKLMHRVLISYGRSGTHWLKYMISSALDRPPIEGGIWDGETLKAILRGCGRRRLIYEHFQFDLHGAIFDPAHDPTLKMILLHRHPLDQFISATWHRIKITGELTNFEPDTHPNEIARGLLLGHYDEKLGFSYRDAHLDTQKRGCLDWVDSGRCMIVKFEDLIENTEAQLIRCLDHLEVRYDPAAIPVIVEKHRFEKLSGGRKPGQMDGTHHYRRGAPGEWQSVFKPEDLPVLQKLYGEHFARQGYPI